MAAGLIVATALVQEKLAAPGPLQADKILVIAPHTEVPDILAQLEQEGVIDSPLLVNVALWVEGNRSKVKAGEYLFRQNASAREVMDTLVSGKQILHSITIPEGLTTDQILDRLRDSDVLTGDIHETPKEGSLLPETYKVTRGMPRDALIRKMEKDQDDAITRIWSRRSPDIPLKSPYELVTLASIVEKETGKADERPRVAEVFLNRLAKRMRLQSDPTIVYGLVGGKGTLGRGILKSEVDQPTPYNTYVIDGLPPGPIANPGVAALEAVANPSRTKELYFVADGTGGHVFAETLDQHAKNVARWRQIEKDVREKTPSIDIDHAPSSALAHGDGSADDLPRARRSTRPEPDDCRSDLRRSADGARAICLCSASAGRHCIFRERRAGPDRTGSARILRQWCGCESRRCKTGCGCTGRTRTRIGERFRQFLDGAGSRPDGHRNPGRHDGARQVPPFSTAPSIRLLPIRSIPPSLRCRRQPLPTSGRGQRNMVCRPVPTICPPMPPQRSPPREAPATAAAASAAGPTQSARLEGGHGADL